MDVDVAVEMERESVLSDVARAVKPLKCERGTISAPMPGHTGAEAESLVGLGLGREDRFADVFLDIIFKLDSHSRSTYRTTTKTT